MKRFFNVKAIFNNEIVEVLSYDRNKYCTIRYNDGRLVDVKKYSLYQLPKGFSFYKLPACHLDKITNKEIAWELRQNKRYHYKRFSMHKRNIKLSFYSDGGFDNKIGEFVGTRKQIIKKLRSINDVDNFLVSLTFIEKSSVSFGSCMTYKNKCIAISSFRNKKQDRFIKQLLRSLFEINVK